MKIIKPGVKRPDVLRGTCTSCGCVIECKRAECRDVGEYGMTCLAVRCPTKECGAYIYPKGTAPDPRPHVKMGRG